MTTPPAHRPLLIRIFQSPNDGRFRSGWRVLLQLVLMFLISIFLGGIFVLLFLRSASISGGFGLIFGIAVTFLGIILSVYLARRWFDHRGLLDLGLHWSPDALKDVGFGVLLTGFLMGIIYLIEWGAGWLKFNGFAWQSQPLGQVLLSVLGMFFVFIVVGFQEELQSRGYQLQNLAEGLSQFWGVLISSVIFAFLHLSNPNFSWTAIVGLSAAGIFLAYAYVRTRKLWLSIGLHIGWNFFEGTVFGFQVSGLTGIPRLIYQTVSGPSLITGQAFGPEAGLIILPVVLLGIAVIYLYTRNRNLSSSEKAVNNKSPIS
jgi:membrane protease YdiL (CAAX protease family)